MSQIANRFYSLSELQKENVQPSKMLANYPHLPHDLPPPCNARQQNKILSQRFPWGCESIQNPINFGQSDRVYSLGFPDEVNVCTGIKYGICPVNYEKFKKITRIYESQSEGSLYLKLNCEIHKYYRTFALCRVNQLRPDSTFRFWFGKSQGHPVGTIFVSYIAVGNIEEIQQEPLEETYHQLSASILQWKYFMNAQDFEWRKRLEYMSVIESKDTHFEDVIVSKNRQLLEDLKFQNKDK